MSPHLHGLPRTQLWGMGNEIIPDCPELFFDASPDEYSVADAIENIQSVLAQTRV